MTTTVDPPASLFGVVDYLSVSSLNTLAQCPIRWRRRYVDRIYEPTTGAQLIGKTVGSAEMQHFGQVMETGEGMTLEQVQDEFDAEWADQTATEEVDFGTDKPGELKDKAIQVLDAMHTNLAPEIVPVSVERKFELSWEGLDWTFLGYLDVEEADGAVSDLKVKGKRISQYQADFDPQATGYLFSQRAEGRPASEFRFRVGVKAAKPFAETVRTTRTDKQLDVFQDRLFLAANEIAWRLESGNWSGATPGDWLCSQKFCGYWSACPFGAAR